MTTNADKEWVTKALAELAAEPKPRVLVVDDSREDLELLCNLLGRYPKLAVVACQNPDEAVALAQADGFSLVMVDLKMFPVDGLEVIRRVQKAQPATRFVAVTGYGEGEQTQKAVLLGVMVVMVKPVTPQDVEQLFGTVRV